MMKMPRDNIFIYLYFIIVILVGVEEEVRLLRR